MEPHVAKYQGLVMRIARHMLATLPAHIELDDLMQVGLIGLHDSFSRYDPTQGVTFETFASHRIRGAMLDELRANDHLSRQLRRDQRAVEVTISALERRLCRAPVEHEIADEMGMSLPRYHDLLDRVKGSRLIYLEDLAAEFLDRTFADSAPGPLEILGERRKRAALVDAIQTLPERERLLMSMHYEKDMLFEEIAAVLNISAGRVSQIHSQTIARLRVKLRQH